MEGTPVALRRSKPEKPGSVGRRSAGRGDPGSKGATAGPDPGPSLDSFVDSGKEALLAVVLTLAPSASLSSASPGERESSSIARHRSSRAPSASLSAALAIARFR